MNILNLDSNSRDLVSKLLRCPASKRSLYDLGLAMALVTTLLNSGVEDGSLLEDVRTVKDNPQSTALVKFKIKYYLRCTEIIDVIMSVAGFTPSAVLDLVILIYYSQVLEITKPISHCWSLSFKGYKDIPTAYNEWIMNEMSELAYITDLSLSLIKNAIDEMMAKQGV